MERSLQDPQDYYTRRAAEERAAAARAANERARESHAELARRYRDAAKQPCEAAAEATEAGRGTLSNDLRILP